MNPRVSFIVPCYKLAHFLPDCINSILRQSYPDFEVLVMDDCSPDDTPAVAASFGDPRVRHIRHVANLGNLRNYNCGIDLTRGKYVWLISADDRLESTEVLGRFVSLLDAYSKVGYVFCSAIDIVEGKASGVSSWTFQQPTDEIFAGHRFLGRLLESNCIHSPSALVRKECYNYSKFPLDLPHSGDWYLWCRFALHYDVGYIAEPMVGYRIHNTNMTRDFLGPKIADCIANEVAVRWKIMHDAKRAGYRDVCKKCEDEIVNDYVRRVAWKQDSDWIHGLTLEDFDRSLNLNARDLHEAKRIRGRVYARLGDHYYWRGNLGRARQFYRGALKQFRTPRLELLTKHGLLRLGAVGIRLRSSLEAMRRAGGH